MEMGEIEKMVRGEIRKEVGMNQEMMMISKVNELFGESDDEEEFMGFDAECEKGCESGVVTE